MRQSSNAMASQRFLDPWATLNAPERAWFRRAAKIIYKDSPMPARSQVEGFAPLFFETDPLADAYADWMHNHGAAVGFRLLSQALDHGIEAVADAPQELQALFAQLDSMPLWVNPSLLNLASDVAARSSIGALMALRNLALMGGYQNAAIAKPLAYTGQLSGNTSRRIAETGNWWVDTVSHGGLSRFGRGFKACVRVRMMHALTRRRLVQRCEWDTNAWGVPINQADMIATNLAFSEGFLLGTRIFGFRYSPAETHAVMHLWRYVGYLMGVVDDQLPTDSMQARRLLLMYTLCSPTADSDSRELAAALVREPYRDDKSLPERLAAPVIARLHIGMTRLVLGDMNADDLGLPRTVFKYAPLAFAPAMYSLETMRRRTPGATKFFVAAGIRLRRFGIHVMLGGKPADYRPVEQLPRRGKLVAA